MNNTGIGRIVFYICALAWILYGASMGIIRVFAPFQFDVFEGKVLCEAYESSLSNYIYHDPDLPGAPTVYTPLYPLLIGLLLRFLPPLFLWGRVVSAVCFIGIIVLSKKMFSNETGKNKVAFIAVIAAMVSTLWKTDWICVLHKPDAMSVFLWVSGLFLLVREKRFCDTTAAILIAGSFFVKQTAIFILPGVFIYLFLDKPRRAAIFFIIWFVSWFMWCAIIYFWGGDHVFFYIFHRMRMKLEYSFPLSQIIYYVLSLRELPFNMAGILIAVCGIANFWKIKSYRLLLCNIPFVYIGSVITAASWTAGANSMLPFYVVGSILCGLAFSAVPEFLHKKRELYLFLAILLVMQFDSKMPYHVSKSLGKFDKEFVELVKFLKKQEGSMYCPSDNVITLLAGKHNYEDIFLAWEIDPLNSEGRIRRVKDKINACNIDWLILHKTEIPGEMVTEETRRRYEKKGTFGDWDVLQKKRGGIEKPYRAEKE